MTVMKKRGRYWRAIWLTLATFLALAPNVLAQDLFREMNQLKKEVAELKQELGDLRNLVIELRRAMLKSVEESGRQITEKSRPTEEKAVKETPAPDEEQMTKTICRAVGQFFSEADVALRSRDASSATSEMDKALHKLYSAVHPYSGTHRVSKLLDIYEGLAWSTYTAVQMRQSVSGNEDFLKALNKHRQRYIDTCPKQ